MGKRLTGKAAKVPVLAYLGVVDEALAADPPHQDLDLCCGGVKPKSVADLHTGIMARID